MNGPVRTAERRFHETPLVIFTALSVLGAGLPAGHFAAWSLGWVDWEPGRLPAAVSAGLLVTGLLVSLSHLGRPARMVYALRCIGRSALSTEVALVALTAGATAAPLLLQHRFPVAAALWGLVAVTSPALLAVLGLVYRVPGQLSWKGAATLTPLLLGLAAGFLTLAAAAGDNARFMFAALALLAGDAAGFVLRWKAIEWHSFSGLPSHPSQFTARRRILLLRLADVTLLPTLLMFAQMPAVALVVLAFGVLVDRFSFYALAIRGTTEAEIARVERLLRSP